MNTTNIDTITVEEFEALVNKNVDMQIENVCTDYTEQTEKEKDDRIEYALANIRAAMTMLDEGQIKAELRSAVHHLTRSE